MGTTASVSEPPESPPIGPPYLSHLPAEIRHLISQHCLNGAIIDRNHQCWEGKHTKHKHTDNFPRNILLTCKTFYYEGIELYYALSLPIFDYCCIETCFSKPTLSATTSRLKRAPHIAMVENMPFTPSADVILKYMAVFPNLEILQIYKIDWFHSGIEVTSSDEEIVTGLEDCEDSDWFRLDQVRCPKIVRERPSLTEQFRQGFVFAYKYKDRELVSTLFSPVEVDGKILTRSLSGLRWNVRLATRG